MEFAEVEHILIDRVFDHCSTTMIKQKWQISAHKDASVKPRPLLFDRFAHMSIVLSLLLDAPGNSIKCVYFSQVDTKDTNMRLYDVLNLETKTSVCIKAHKDNQDARGFVMPLMFHKAYSVHVWSLTHVF